MNNIEDFARDFPRAAAVYQAEAAAGHHTGAQVYVSRGGQTLADLGLGESRPGIAMTRDSLLLWLSAGKPLTAVATLQLMERGQLRLDDRVETFIPEFGQNGKAPITIEHLLTHTGGFRWAAIGHDDTPQSVVIARICAMKLEKDWIIGETAGYHPYTSWHILGEIVRRVVGRPPGEHLRDAVLLPLGMRDTWVGLPREQYQAYGDRVAPMFNTEKGDRPAHFFSTETGAMQCAPGGNTQGPIRELGRFYEALLAGGDGVLTPQTVRLMTSRVRQGKFDLTFRAVVDWGLGIICDSKQYGVEDVPYGYGRHASDSAFGHSGSQSSAAFADPEFQLVVAVVFNGMPGEAAHQARIKRFLEALYEDLGLANRSEPQRPSPPP